MPAVAGSKLNKYWLYWCFIHFLEEFNWPFSWIIRYSESTFHFFDRDIFHGTQRLHTIITGYYLATVGVYVFKVRSWCTLDEKIRFKFRFNHSLCAISESVSLKWSIYCILCSSWAYSGLHSLAQLHKQFPYMWCICFSRCQTTK